MYIAPKVKPLCPPELPPRFEDVVYGEVTLDSGEAYTLKLDIYQSAQQTEMGPCIIYIFGGGWMWGEYKQVTQKAVYCRDLVRLTKEGYTVVCPDYRLASQSVFPACIHDVKGAVRFLKANGERYHIDPKRIGVLGNSAGGHLASMLAVSAQCKELEGDVGGNLDFDSSVKAAALFYAPSDLCGCIASNAASIAEATKDLSGTEIDNFDQSLTDRIPALILGHHDVVKLNDLIQRGDTTDPDWKYIELAKLCSPMTYVRADLPPIAIFQGAKDIVVEPSQSEDFYHALAKAGADATYVAFSGGCHGPSLGSQIDSFAYTFLKDRL